MDARIEACMKTYLESRNVPRGRMNVYPEPAVFRISDKLRRVLDTVIPSDTIPVYWKFCACFSVYHSPRESELFGMCRDTFDRGFVGGVFDADEYISLEVGYDGAENLDVSRYPMVMDPMLSSFILEMNRRGYATATSCSGHSWKNILDNGYYRLENWQRGNPYYDGVSRIEVYFRSPEDDFPFMNDLIRDLNALGIQGSADGRLLRLNFWSEEETPEGQIQICPSITNLTGMLKFSMHTICENLAIIAAEYASDEDAWVRAILPTRRPRGIAVN